MLRSLKETLNRLHRKDLEDLEGLKIDSDNDERSAERCGCRQCRRLADLSYEDYWWEYKRIHGKHSDHEEDILYQTALRRLTESKDEKRD